MLLKLTIQLLPMPEEGSREVEVSVEPEDNVAVVREAEDVVLVGVNQILKWFTRSKQSSKPWLTKRKANREMRMFMLVHLSLIRISQVMRRPRLKQIRLPMRF